MIDLNSLNKDELEALGREKGIELDRRVLKSKMVNQLKDFIKTLPEEEVVVVEEKIEISDDITEVQSIQLSHLMQLASGYGVDTSNVTTKGKLISLLLQKL
jgi:hypothetical protein